MTLKEYIIANNITREEIDKTFTEIDKELIEQRSRREFEVAKERFIQAATDYDMAMDKYFGRPTTPRATYEKENARTAEDLANYVKSAPKFLKAGEKAAQTSTSSDEIIDRFLKELGL